MSKNSKNPRAASYASRDRDFSSKAAPINRDLGSRDYGDETRDAGTAGSDDEFDRADELATTEPPRPKLRD